LFIDLILDKIFGLLNEDLYTFMLLL